MHTPFCTWETTYFRAFETSQDSDKELIISRNGITSTTFPHSPPTNWTKTVEFKFCPICGCELPK